ncbi:MAG: energy transducer TonB [Spirochaeta sp.]|jgi:protein TonB|nr:energy transducer TonB [Spirochaeta sp.]
MDQPRSRTRRSRLSDDTRRMLAAATVALIVHGAVFAAIEFAPETERETVPPERIAVVVTRIDSSPQQQVAADDAITPEPTDASVEENNLETPQVIQARDTGGDFGEVTPVRLSDTTVERLFGEGRSQPEPEKTESERQQTDGGGTGPALFERASQNSQAVGAAEAAADRTIHPDRRYVKPEYPERARRAGVEGTTVVTFEIDRRGRPDEISLEESSGSTLLDREAMRAVQLWRFSRESAGRVSVHRIEFRLEEDS